MSDSITISQSTIDSYLQANYFVVDRSVGDESSTKPAEYQIRIGQTTPQIAPMLERHGATTGFIVTAWNPHSIEQAREQNDQANQRMLQHDLLQNPEIHCYASYGSDDAATWREEGFFLVGMGVSQAQALCKTFSQNAGVMVSTDQPARLIWHPDALLP